MSTVILVTPDTLSGVPKLDVKGTSWAIFAFRFQVAVKAKSKELWNHFDGSSPPPSFSPPLTPDQTVTVSEWRKDESLAMHLLIQCIPDSTALRIHRLTTVRDMWNEIVREYTEKESAAVRCVAIDEKDYHSMIIKSLPVPLANFAASQLASARLFSPTKTIERDAFVSIIVEEAERLKSKGVLRHDYRVCDRGEAMGVTPPPKHHGRGRGKRTAMH